MSFENAHPTLVAALSERGYAAPTPVQAGVLDPATRGRDLLVSARTGSGKTVAFGLCLAENLLGDAPRLGPAGAPLALVVAPTRELAQQVRQELAWLWAPTGARVVSCVGGMDPRRESRALAEGAHIVVGTPGRLCDHLDRGALRLGGVRAVVLDEADEMLDLGFRDELERLLQATPTERRTLLFSATLPPGILGLAGSYQRDALRIAATSADEPHADIEHRAVLVAPREREHAIVNLLRMVNPSRAIVFCATRDGVGHLHQNLVERGFTAVALSGELTQAERGRALQALRDGRARVLVATDVAARGLDLPDLELVIHADLPNDAQVLLHRSGRTGRAGKKGTSVLIVASNRRFGADRLIREARIAPRWSEPPLAEAILAKDHERVGAELAVAIADTSEEERVAAADLVAAHPPEALAAALVRLWKSGWPEPEELPETEHLHRKFGGRARREDEAAPPAREPRPAWPEKPVRVRPGQLGRVAEAGGAVEPPGAGATEVADPGAEPTVGGTGARPEVVATASPEAGGALVAAGGTDAPARAVGPETTASGPVGRTPKRRPSVAAPGGDASERRAPRFDGDRGARFDGDRGARFDGDRGARFDADRGPRFDGDRGPRFDGDRGPRFDGDRGARSRDGDDDGGVWFRMNVGRANQADPRWLVPLICRRGRIEKPDIGAIRILEGETRFEVDPRVAGRFAAAVRRPDTREPWVRIVPMERW